MVNMISKNNSKVPENQIQQHDKRIIHLNQVGYTSRMQGYFNI
jgi:hypothetical protein